MQYIDYGHTKTINSNNTYKKFKKNVSMDKVHRNFNIEITLLANLLHVVVDDVVLYTRPVIPRATLENFRFDVKEKSNIRVDNFKLKYVSVPKEVDDIGVSFRMMTDIITNITNTHSEIKDENDYNKFLDFYSRGRVLDGRVLIEIEEVEKIKAEDGRKKSKKRKSKRRKSKKRK